MTLEFSRSQISDATSPPSRTPFFAVSDAWPRYRFPRELRNKQDFVPCNAGAGQIREVFRFELIHAGARQSPGAWASVYVPCNRIILNWNRWPSEASKVDFSRQRMSVVESWAVGADRGYRAGEPPLSSTLPSGSDAPKPDLPPNVIEPRGSTRLNHSRSGLRPW
jgi:hypothetical protein